MYWLAASEDAFGISSFAITYGAFSIYPLDSSFDPLPKRCIISFTHPAVSITSDNKFALSYKTYSDNPRQFWFLTSYKSSGWTSSKIHFSGPFIAVWGVLVFVTLAYNLLDKTVCSLFHSTQLCQCVQCIASPVSCLCIVDWIAISQLSICSPT